MLSQVYAESPRLEKQAFSFDPTLASKRISHAGENLIHPEGFCQIVCGSKIERLNSYRLIPAARQDERGDIWRMLLDVP